MQRVIDRKLYDTDRAEQIAQYAPIADASDFRYLIETLYKTADGEYFLHCNGGPFTEYAGRSQGQWVGGQEINLLDVEAALDWCEDCGIDGEIVVEEFDHLVET